MSVLPSLILFQALTATSLDATAGSHFRIPEASASGRILSPVGLFPIWENTAAVLGEGRLYLGSQLVGVGLPGRVQIGMHPLRALNHVPNVHAKLLLLDGASMRLAAHVEVLAVLDAAPGSFTVSNFASRLTHAAWVAPAGLSTAWSPTRRVFLHLTATAQAIASDALPTPQVIFGTSARLELRPFDHHAFSLHAAEVGFHQHDFWQAGASYRYQRWIFEASAGFELRRYRDGYQGFPIASVAVEL